ncbi:MAG TPA: LuxR C-terminal-related transcriptional regulator [Actinophytocola sp.]|uniref:helix-turn-helix transcriptional regulator n=1 Tax=Actinophytocola sp. TaxID=1872138 RepID=UPI002DBCB6A2|nr:LuxR C-terminal-related transcriptional regulator [Actinophytocola sp.]HEU5473325.1 LuxR C-terminal-related transcriptional regulator [Actinophytocola sp.]
MSDVTARDLRRALELVRELNADDTDDEVVRSSLAALERLVGSDTAGVIGHDSVTRRLTIVTTTRPDRNLLARPGFAAAVAQHPGFAACRSGRLPTGTSAALTDLADLRTLRQLPLYVDYYRPDQTADQLLCVVNLNGRRGTVLLFNRSRPGFSRRDRDIVDLLAPHVSQAIARRERIAALLAASRHTTRLTEQAERSLARLPDLTSRERQVAAHVAGGSTDREIARNLGISPRTVHKHLELIYRKLNLTNRGSLSALLVRWTRT